MSRELTKQAGIASPYETRRMMVGMLKRSQSLEHKFYLECKEAVRQASSRLVEHFSDLIQRQMPQWTEQDCCQFTLHSGIRSEKITRWRSSIKGMLDARAATEAAAGKLKAAEAEKSESGGFFGAKKGREAAYRTASEQHQCAVGNLDNAKNRLSVATRLATEAAEVLLGECVGHAGVLAESTDYALSRVPRDILVEAAARANALAKAHSDEQSLINSELHRGLNALKQNYDAANE